MSFLCIIPARKNSKRIKNKNLIKIRGKSLIAITIMQAKKCKYIPIENIFVSSDSERIIQEAKLYGAKAPFLRPANLSRDKSKMHDVLNHAYKLLKKKISFKYIIMLQPTSPLRTSRHIDQACKLFLQNIKNTSKLVSVTELPIEFNPEKIMEASGQEISQLTGYKNYNNSKKKYFLRNGPAIFIYSKKKLNNNIYAGKSTKFLMSEKSSLDLNVYSDIRKIIK